MLEYLIPPDADTSEARRQLSLKGEAQLRQQDRSLLASLKRINSQCRIVTDGRETGFDWMRAEGLDGDAAAREAAVLRMASERKAIREELQTRQSRDIVQREVETPVVPERTATGESPASRMESLIGDRVHALLEQSGPGAGFTPQGGRQFLETHPDFKVPGMTLSSILVAQHGHPRAATMTQGGATTEGYKPFNHRDLMAGLMAREITNYTGLLQKRSTGGLVKLEYQRESQQDLDAGVTTETGSFATHESDFTVDVEELSLRKVSTTANFSAEQMRGASSFVEFLTTRLQRAVANRVEAQLITGNNNAGSPASGQLHGLNTYAGAGTAMTAGEFGLDEIEKALSNMEDVAGQMASACLMGKDEISALRRWHVSPQAATRDLQYIIGFPSGTQPLLVWGVPIVRVPSLTSGDVYLVDSIPIILHEDGEDMKLRFTDAHGTHFTSDVWSANASAWCNAAYSRVVPTTGALNAPYVTRITGWEVIKS